MKELYEAILERLTVEEDPEKIADLPDLKMIDFEMGQLGVLELDEKPAVKFPCALIDISYPACDDEGDKMQMVTARFNVKLAFECPLPTDSLASEARRSAALEIFTTDDKVYKRLQGYSDDNFSAFSRKSKSPDNRFAGIKIINIVFETTFEDLTAQDEA